MHPARTTVRLFAAALLCTVAAALVLAACGGTAATTTPSVASTAAMPTGAASIAALPTASAEATASPTVAVTAVPVTEPPVTAPPPRVAPGIGVKLLIGDQQYMTVLAAEQWAGTSQVKPRSGKAFFTVSIRIDAIALTSWDSADFKLLDTSGHSYAWRVGRSPHLYDGANLTAGNNYVGWITYEIPKTSLVGLTLVYKPRFLGGVTFKIPVS